MTWHDSIIGLVSLSFSVLLLPQLYDCIANSARVNVFTALFTSGGLFILAFTFFTLKMWQSAVSSLLTAAMWLLIGIFSIF